MEKNTLTRERIKEALYNNIGLSKEECSELVEWVFDTISDTLISGQDVKLSSFGSFKVKKKKKRTGRNPKTGVEVEITPRSVVTFDASDKLKKAVAAGGR